MKLLLFCGTRGGKVTAMLRLIDVCTILASTPIPGEFQLHYNEFYLHSFVDNAKNY